MAPVSLQTLKPAADRANPKIGIGALAFSPDSYFLATRNGERCPHAAAPSLCPPPQLCLPPHCARPLAVPTPSLCPPPLCAPWGRDTSGWKGASADGPTRASSPRAAETRVLPRGLGAGYVAPVPTCTHPILGEQRPRPPYSPGLPVRRASMF